MCEIHRSLKKIIWKSCVPNIFVSLFGLQFIWAISENNTNSSTQQRNLNDKKRESRADWQYSICRYCWEQDTHWKKIHILKFWAFLNQQLRRRQNSLVQPTPYRPLLQFLFGLEEQACTIQAVSMPACAVQALVCRCLHLPQLCQLAGAAVQKDARWLVL